MKTAEELKALKEELETLNKKLAELTDEELTQVSGGSSRRTDDPDQKKARNCFILAEGLVEHSTILPADTKNSILSILIYCRDRTLSEFQVDPLDLIPKVEEVIAALNVYINQEVMIRMAWDKMKTALTCLENMQKKDA